MRIAFICGALEPGKDGVGDYTRRLSGELLRTGNQITAISLNETYIESVDTSSLNTEEARLSVLRIPRKLSDDERYKLVKQHISNFEPDWISLQFVPFSFHDKGLNFFLARNLKLLGKDCKWHIMFHELWVGMEQSAVLKMKIWGGLQKLLIVKLLNTLQPTVIQTQIFLYKKQLELLGYQVNILPLFSNIAVHQFQNTFKDNTTNQTTFIFIIFGNLHHNAEIENLATEALEYGKMYNLNVELRIIGRCGAEQELWKKIWSEKGIKVKIFGEQPEEIISQQLQEASVGIATTPSYLVEKSGVVAAMIEHGLLVLNIAREWRPNINIELKMPQNVIDYKRGKLLKMHIKKRNPINIVNNVSQAFMNCLTLN